jgi:photosystem II stability/assembly factor-like uncharacterized protein
VLPAITISGSGAVVDFDVTSDGGRDWKVQSQRSIGVVPNSLLDLALTLGYPLTSITSSSTWWLLGWSPTGVTTDTTTDGGSRWVQVTAPRLEGVPLGLAALNAHDALLTMQQAGGSDVAFVTLNRGRSWENFTPRT